MTEVTKEFIQKNEDEKIIEIEIERLRSFKNHPFQVKDDNEMHLLKESIEKYGILAPLIVRPVSDMKFEVCEMNVTEADVKERVFFLNIMVRNTFPFSRLPFTVSISTIDTSGFASTNELKSSIVRP